MRKTLVALALIAGLAGCGDDNNNKDTVANPAAPEAPPATIALVTATANPVFVTAVATADPAFPWAISWVTTVKETAGIAATVNRITVVLVDVTAVYEGDNLGGTAAIAANGTSSFNQALFYSLPDAGRLAVVSIIVDLTDSKGNKIQAAAQLRIQ
jgi:hypothetical protein